MIPARSAPDLQWIRAGYSMVSNICRAPRTLAREGTSREVTTKSTMVRPSRSQASRSRAWVEVSKPPRRLITVLIPRRFHSFSWNGQGWLARTSSSLTQWSFMNPRRSQAWSVHR